MSTFKVPHGLTPVILLSDSVEVDTLGLSHLFSNVMISSATTGHYRMDTCCIIIESLDELSNQQDIPHNVPVIVIQDLMSAKIPAITNPFGLNIIVLDNSIAQGDLMNIIEDEVSKYLDMVIDPYTKGLMAATEHHKVQTYTPGHSGGKGYELTPSGIFFKQFFGNNDNIFKSDTSVSDASLGSLLDRSGIHRDAEQTIAEAYGADDAYMITNGTSTANKTVANYASTDGQVVVIDRNCHKSACHSLMRNNTHPIYLKPARNAYGILGGLPKSEFTEESINAKLASAGFDSSAAPTYAIITNSTYDGIFYKTQFIVDTLKAKNIHFDSAWVTYNAFHPIYKGLNGMSVNVPTGKVVFETQSTHKLGLSFSQASQILVKGTINTKVMHDAFMMDSSTSPFYPMVASIVNSAQQLSSVDGKKMLDKHIDLAISFRQDLARTFKTSNPEDAILKMFQPENINKSQESWEIRNGDTWHGFKNVDADHLYLDPIKVTVLTRGFDANDQLIENGGIPASIVSKYLEDHNVIVEKSGPYNLLFLFAPGITAAKAEDIKLKLCAFVSDYKANKLVSEMLPTLYKEHSSFYRGMTIQELCNGIHQVMRNFKLADLMFSAFDVLPKMVMTPHVAWSNAVLGNIVECKLKDVKDQIMADMILPYPPGVPLVLPGEMITDESKAVLDFLIMLTEVGKAYPGFETDIHGVTYNEKDGEYYTIVMSK